MLANTLIDRQSEYQYLMASCLKHARPITAPLALISQIQRSGGSMLSQLFDGHPEVHAHPHELKIGYPKKFAWPKLDLNEKPEKWFLLLFEDIVLTHMKEGYKKLKKEKITHPFAFLPDLQQQLFLNHLKSMDPVKPRDIYDAYMTSYFGAWLNNSNLHRGIKKFVVGFTPRFAMRRENMTGFFEIYPDGKLISIVRDPKNWYPSAMRHKPNVYPDVSTAIDQWLASVRATLWSQETFGERVCIIRFEDLIGQTESVMRHLSDFLGIEFDPILLKPTFNRSPIRANTSFEIEKEKIVSSTLYRYQTLKRTELETIISMTAAAYELVLSKAARFHP
jgi:Sulfotransferase family